MWFRSTGLEKKSMEVSWRTTSSWSGWVLTDLSIKLKFSFLFLEVHDCDLLAFDMEFFWERRRHFSPGHLSRPTCLPNLQSVFEYNSNQLIISFINIILPIDYWNLAMIFVRREQWREMSSSPHVMESCYHVSKQLGQVIYLF